MAENKKGGGGSIFGEIGLALITFAIMIGSIIGADYIEQKQCVTADCAFIIKEFATYISRLSLVILMVWIYVNIGFPRTIGRDFESRFESGWDELSNADAVKWMIVVFLGLFIGGSIMMLA
ncbi:MAG: hypothetical protein AAGJ31_13480 [Verrucomicrobiota bacterium]